MRRLFNLFIPVSCITLIATLVPGLSGTTGIARGQVLAGDEAQDHFGRAVAWAGDVNGDGLDDFLVGIPGSDASGNDAGEVHLYLGQVGRFPDLPALVLTGQSSGDEFGYAVCTAGDIDRDGFDDFLVGAPGRNSDGLDAGRVYLFLGDATPNSTPDKTWDGDLPGGRFGTALAGGFRFNGDTRPDFAVGAPSHNGAGLRAGQVKIFLGSASGYATETYDFRGDFPNWELGFALDCAGDFNRDGFDDLIAGAPQNFDQNSGRVILWFGKGSSLGDPDRLVLSGEFGSDRFGTDVSGVGDINGDAADDVIVGAPRHDGGGLDKGAVYLFRGSPNPDTSFDWKATGASGGDRLGTSLDGGFDMNDDGDPDFAAGAPGADTPSSGAGEVRIYYGRSNPAQSGDRVLAPVPPISSFEANDEFGSAVRFVGDYNGDGNADLVAGAPMGNTAAGGEAGYVNFVTYPGSFTPVQLLFFEAERTAVGTRLRWRLTEDDGLAGLKLERMLDGASTPVHAGWLSPVTREYLVPDRDAPEAPVRYRLTAEQRNGVETRLGETGVVFVRPGPVLGAPDRNPFRTGVVVPLGHSGGSLRATVWDAQGRAVRRLLDEDRPAGSLSIAWDGRDGSGRLVSAGVYFLRVDAGGRSAGQRLVRIP